MLTIKSSKLLLCNLAAPMEISIGAPHSTMDVYSDQWLNQSMNFSPIDEYAEVPPQQQSHVSQLPIKVEHTAQLIREFDSVYEVVELTHLTPPQSPPHSSAQLPLQQHLAATFAHQVKQADYSFATTHFVGAAQTVPIIEPNNQFYVYDDDITPAASPTSQEDIAHEMDLVEELVRSRAENLGDWTDEDDDDEHSFASTTASSSSFSPRSESSYGDSNFSNDDEWTPSAAATQSSSTKTNAAAGHITNSAANKAPAAKRRSRPYGRSSEDKKSRKKEQNKNAATRYRQKKKAEIEVALDEERELQDIHSSLEVSCADVKREIKYLKSLMREIYQAKGIL